MVMMMLIQKSFTLLVYFSLVVPAAAGEAALPPHADVVVYGGTPAGIAAAIAASQDGASVVLVEPTRHIGGLTTSGLSHTDFRTYEGLTGTFLDFTKRVEAYYREKYGADSQQVKDCRRGTQAEPHVNELIFEAMLAEWPTVRIAKGLTLTRTRVETFGGRTRLTRITLVDSAGKAHSLEAAMFIDGTYEGDLMAAAGVEFAVGREGRDKYGESLAPEQPDGQLQAYNFRFAMTPDPQNSVPLEKPADYRREDFKDVVPLLLDGRIKKVFDYPKQCIVKAQLPALPNDKYDINDVSAGLVRLSMPGQNLEWPNGDRAARERVFAKHMTYNVGLLWFLQHDEAVPKELQADARRWGWCRDEFTDNGHLPWQLYVREARRMIGQTVFTQHHVEQSPGDVRSAFQPDSIAIGDYGPNCHGTSHEGPRYGGKHTGEFYQRVAPYQIPYGVIVPKEVDNLLVPVACSASHVGFCALRLEPIWTGLGQAAGTAARLAIDKDLAVQDVKPGDIQRRLHAKCFAAVQWLGGLGALHGLVPAGEKYGERGRNLEGQYYAAFPGHGFEPERAAEFDDVKKWMVFVPRADAQRIYGGFRRILPPRGEIVLRLYETPSKD
jgi:hypothetical protein